MIKNIEQSKNRMGSLIDSTRDAVVDATERAEGGMESAAKRVVKKAHVAGKYVRGGAETASHGAHRGLDEAAKAIDRGYTRTRSRLSGTTTALTDYVTENPGKAVLLSASSGFALGMLARWGATAGNMTPEAGYESRASRSERKEDS